jgi:hypothetical protein
VKEEKENAIALILVIVIITALVAIASPFLVSMRLSEKSSKNYLDNVKAREIASGALNHAIYSLYRTHDCEERHNYLASIGKGEKAGREDASSGEQGFSTPDFDLPEEYDISFPQLTFSDGSPFTFTDPSGAIWSVQVQDEQAKVNLNSATPWLIANLMGVTELIEKIDVKETEIKVADTSVFYADTDPESIDGFVKIDSEYIAYRGKTKTSLTGCLRGMFLEAEKHAAGSLVYDGRAFKIAQHRVHNERGHLTLFSTPASVKDIANWTKFDAVLESLMYRKLYLEKLREYGVKEEDIANAGIDPQQLVAPKEQEKTPEMKEIESGLRAKGIDPEILRRFVGDSLVRRVSRQVTNIPPQRLERMIERYNELVQEIEAEEKEEVERLKKYLPDAFKSMELLKQILYLETLSALEFRKIEDFITTYSWRAKEWSPPVTILADIPEIERAGEVNKRRVPIPDRQWFNRGTIIRIRDSKNCEYAILAGRDKFGRLVTDADLKYSYEAGKAQVEALLRHPVNINTCDDRVLKALLVGLQIQPFERTFSYFWGRQRRTREEEDTGFVSPAEADILIKRIRQSPPTCYADLSNILKESLKAEEISQWDAAAILTNAINPNDPSLFVSTAPFAFKSYNIFTIEATGMVNSAVGEELARHTIREVIQVSPPRALTWNLETQQDFCAGIVRNLDTQRGRASFIRFADREANKIATRPNPVAPISGEYQFPSISRSPDEGDMRIETARLTGGNKYSEHYDDTIEGKYFDNGFSVSTTQNFPIIGIDQKNGRRSLGAGYFACWFKPIWSSGIHYFLDTGEAEFENRITFYYDGRDIVLMVCDATLDKIGQTLRAPFRFTQDTWYHIAACWKGVRYGDLAIFVDGKSVGKYENFTRLSGDIDSDAYEIMVEDASQLPIANPDPANGVIPVIQIDGEAMEVIARAGNKLTVKSQMQAPPSFPPPQGWTPKLVRVSCRGTTLTYHKDGAIVTVWGYSNELLEDVHIGGAVLAPNYPLPFPTPVTYVSKQKEQGSPGQPVYRGVKRGDTEIPVESTANFPPTGIILIESEKIHYKRATGNKFTGCTRGIENTQDADHENGKSVTLISIMISGGPKPSVPTGDYIENGYIQIDNEWIRYEKAQTEPYRSNYLIMPSQSVRGELGTAAESHNGGEKVIPVFRVAQPCSGKSDSVTLLDDTGRQPEKVAMIVNHSATESVVIENRVELRYYAAFTDFVPRQFYAENWGRILKFPSGELPTTIQENTLIGGRMTPGGTGPISATIDEIAISQDGYAPYGFVVGASVDASASAIPVGVRALMGGSEPPGGTPNTGGILRLSQSGGLVKVDDEIIGVCGVEGARFYPVKRGLLGSSPSPHAEGAKIYIIPYPRAAAFDGSLTDTSVPIRNPGEVPEEGFVQVARQASDGEILPYRSVSGGGQDNRYQDVNGLGVFRGAFGSPKTGCTAQDIGIFIPFRYYDLYEANRDSRQGVYYYAVTTVEKGFFKRITWDATIPQGTVVIVQVRIDGEPGWDCQPTNSKGGIFQFTEPEGNNIIDVAGDRVEVRVYLTYLDGAYATDVWKRTPEVRSITLEYVCPPVVLSHEVLGH